VKNRKPDLEPKRRTPDDKLAAEAAAWDERKLTPAGFRDAPEAIPNASRTVAISLRMPAQLLAVLKRCAAREGVGYQVLIKKWLDDRLRSELAALKSRKGAGPESGPPARSSGNVRYAPLFPLRDRADSSGAHYTTAGDL
jgi:predicted DNA binding CopG/RHH family protein